MEWMVHLYDVRRCITTMLQWILRVFFCFPCLAPVRTFITWLCKFMVCCYCIHTCIWLWMFLHQKPHRRRLPPLSHVVVMMWKKHKRNYSEKFMWERSLKVMRHRHPMNRNRAEQRKVLCCLLYTLWKIWDEVFGLLMQFSMEEFCMDAWKLMIQEEQHKRIISVVFFMRCLKLFDNSYGGGGGEKQTIFLNDKKHFSKLSLSLHRCSQTCESCLKKFL